jgi:hydroxymethylglutaryl-CoA lyase
MIIPLPVGVTVVEVGPRDGLQSLPTAVPTAMKVAMVHRLVAAGFSTIEVTAFVRPDVVPNLADAEKVMASVPRTPGVTYRALAPNARGAERAAAAGVDEICGLVTVSETYTRLNQNMGLDQAVGQALEAGEISAAAGIPHMVAVGMSMFCPYEGRIPEERTLDVVARLHAGGVRRISLAGSTGMEDPRHVNGLFQAVRHEWPDMETGYHVHDLAGMGPANVLASLAGGATVVEGSIAGIGGGIAMPGDLGPVGNIATEDLVRLLNEMGVQTGIQTDDAIAAARDVAALLGITPRSFATRTGTREHVLEQGRRFPAERRA